MTKALTAIIAVLAIASFGLFASGSAQAGGASSAPSKYSNTTNAAYGQQLRLTQTSYTITEFSSSSAKVSAPKR